MRPPADYEGDIGNQVVEEAVEPDDVERMERRAMRVICTKLAGSAIVRIVGRCDDAIETSELDLSECLLAQVPDAVYHLMRNTELKACNLSGNTITKIPPKFAVKFSLITDLNLANNQMARLPDELATLADLQRLDISHNTFVQLPDITPRIPSLKILLAHHNRIIEVDVDRLKDSRSLEELDLRNNPIPPQTHQQLQEMPRLKVHLSERVKEEWEDLEI